ncbi:LacI family DNA-binding transcriptional regulator [Catenulispora rubra]|uniref:LacI family DNA-binding transcriptional regulator n=1 Tax=Catenulispora rubra TaxID=280293 RepID=UPI00189243E9|nr:LacI family DNA-binding transcriptional regulator [Catenulispora rubra]
MGATIREVARQAEVSIATVSRALNSPHLVAERTRSRVVDTALRLGYPSRRPRSAGAVASAASAAGRIGFVGAVLPDLANPFYPAVLYGMRSASVPAGQHVLSLDAAEDPAAEADLIRMIAGQVDSLVLLSSRLPDDRLRALCIPGRTVLFNRLIPGLPGVVVDYLDGMRRMVAHLASLGHRRIGYAGGPRASFADAERRRGLAVSSQAAGLRVVDLGRYPPYFTSGAQIADRALRENVTAVIAFNDLMALGTLVRLRELRIDVPGRISVAGFDGVPLAAAGTPRLTTVVPPLGRAGRTAMALLRAATESSAAAPRWCVLPVRLMVGTSTAPPPGL